MLPKPNGLERTAISSNDNSTNWFKNKEHIAVVGEPQTAAKKTVICYIKSAIACLAILSAQLFSDARMSLISDTALSDLFACYCFTMDRKT